MKTCKFYYSVYHMLDSDDSDYPNSERPVFAHTFQTLAMARNFCSFNKGHYVILCEGKLEYNRGSEIK